MAGAIDEQVAFDAAVVARGDGGDIALVVRLDRDHLVGDVPHAEPVDRVMCEQRRKLYRIEVVTVIERTGIVGHRALARGEVARARLGLCRHRRGERHVRRLAAPRRHQFIRVERGWRGERMKIAIVRAAIAPTIEPRSLFERAIAGQQELGLADANRCQRLAQRRPAALSDPDGRNVGRLDQRNRRWPRGQLRRPRGEVGRRQPASSPAADNDDTLDRPFHLFRLLRPLRLLRRIGGRTSRRW